MKRQRLFTKCNLSPYPWTKPSRLLCISLLRQPHFSSAWWLSPAGCVPRRALSPGAEGKGRLGRFPAAVPCRARQFGHWGCGRPEERPWEEPSGLLRDEGTTLLARVPECGAGLPGEAGPPKCSRGEAEGNALLWPPPGALSEWRARRHAQVSQKGSGDAAERGRKGGSLPGQRPAQESGSGADQSPPRFPGDCSSSREVAEDRSPPGDPALAPAPSLTFVLPGFKLSLTLLFSRRVPPNSPAALLRRRLTRRD